MPPRIPLAQRARCCRPLLTPQLYQSSQGSLVSLFAAISIQTRNANILASLSDNRGAYHKRIRRGRGPSSGYGKTSGRGHKGQKQHGKVKPWFQGGQTPMIRAKGRFGFENKRAPEMSLINLDNLQSWIDSGRLDPTKPITPIELYRSGLVGSTVKDGIKLLARGASALRTPIDIIVSRASAGAIDAIEGAGGKIVTRFYTRDSLARLFRGESAHTAAPLPMGPEHVEPVLEAVRGASRPLYRMPDPTSRADIEYYRDPAHRGYLSHLLKPGESPSLYFKVPTQKKIVKVRTDKEQKKVVVTDTQLF